VVCFHGMSETDGLVRMGFGDVVGEDGEVEGFGCGGGFGGGGLEGLGGEERQEEKGGRCGREEKKVIVHERRC